MLRLTALIEEMRAQLIRLSEIHGLTHPKTIQCSQQLDQLINLAMKKQTGLVTNK